MLEFDLTNPGGQCVAIQHGHIAIGNDHIESTGTPVLEGHGAVVGRNDMVGQMHELLSKQHAVGWVVIHYQYLQGSVRLPYRFCRGLNRDRRGLQCLQGESHARCGSNTGFAIQVDSATHHVRQLPAD
ncbi:hypothetical protein D9M71_650090 [compost metagenome]